jgi:hypothetical protein
MYSTTALHVRLLSAVLFNAYKNTNMHLNRTKSIKYIPQIHTVEYKNCPLKEVRFINLRQKVGTGAEKNTQKQDRTGRSDLI